MAVEKRYNMDFENILKMFHDKGVSYEKAAKELNYKVNTIVRYCFKYNLKLVHDVQYDKYTTKEEQIYSQIRSPELNKIKVMSMRW